MSKEQAYDAEIAPLMTKIIEICHREKIAMVADFAVPNDEDPKLHCTTALLSDEYGPSKEQLAAKSMLYEGFAAFAIRTRPMSSFEHTTKEGK